MSRLDPSRWGAPATYVSVVVAVSVMLVAVLLRSPDTRANYQASPEGYHRTALASFDGVTSYEGLGEALGTDPGAAYFAAGCASCHGLRGEGGAVGPPIWTKSVEELVDSVREGPAGMPAFPADQITDELAAAIVSYLNDQRNQYPDEPERGPARAGSQTEEEP